MCYFHSIAATAPAAVAALVAALVEVAAAAQGVAVTGFDVASVKPNRSGSRTMSFQVQPGGRFVATNATLAALIQSTYTFDLLDYQIIGAEGWITTERFDVDARTSRDVPSREVATTLVRSLLVDRFRLRSHRETRSLPVLTLRLAHRNPTFGSGLRPSAGACTAGGADPEAQPEARRCGLRIDDDAAGVLHLSAVNVTIKEIANRLQFYVKRAVIDETGLTGAFDVEAAFARPIQASTGADPAAAPDAPSLQRAFEDQLGIRVESREMPLDVLIIDGAQRPEAN